MKPAQVPEHSAENNMLSGLQASIWNSVIIIIWNKFLLLPSIHANAQNTTCVTWILHSSPKCEMFPMNTY